MKTDDNSTQIEIDDSKLQRIQWRVYLLERQNAITNEKTDSQMIEEIKKIIETEVKKCY